MGTGIRRPLDLRSRPSTTVPSARSIENHARLAFASQMHVERNWKPRILLNRRQVAHCQNGNGRFVLPVKSVKRSVMLGGWHRDLLIYKDTVSFAEQFNCGTVRRFKKLNFGRCSWEDCCSNQLRYEDRDTK